ncbi:MAG: RluA family pseudouridine synthase [Lachnospiraceae bacterium]|nr:RluA family pseudouridine synthase [Lachnospiraceae bacterium]
MKEFIISESEAGLTVIKYSSKILKKAPGSLIHKFIRNKNIELNRKKCKENEVINAGDRVAFFLSDETFEKFSDISDNVDTEYTKCTLEASRILYEDEDYLFYDKPAGLITQKDESGRVSLNDQLLGYCGIKGVLRPSICNRLDTNTSGIVLCGKSIKGLQKLNNAIKEHRIRKTYRAVLWGRIEEEHRHLVSFIRPLDNENRMEISDRPGKGYKEIITDLTLIASNEQYSYAELNLITGRKHQIRAQMAHIMHPVVGDIKYGENSRDNKKAGRQLLHAYRVELPEEILNGLTVFAPVPEDIKKLAEGIRGIN